MSQSLRLSEKWFRRGLWLVAVVFAWFLIGLGGSVINDLPRVENIGKPTDLIDQKILVPLNDTLRLAERKESELTESLKATSKQLDRARNRSAAERETFNNWIEARKATEQSTHNAEVIARTRTLDQLKAKENAIQKTYDTVHDNTREAQKNTKALRAEIEVLEKDARTAFAEIQRAAMLRVFFYRLAFTLPLLVIAAGLFVKCRKSTYWPFVWGFILFALFAFFVELVPYLPHFGGYVRYGVGIVVTVIIGRYTILALNRYLERQKNAESLPDVERRKELNYEVILARLSKNVCPGCERVVDLKNDALDHCPHCGISLFNRCTPCNTRKSAFARFCFSCGSVGKENP